MHDGDLVGHAEGEREVVGNVEISEAAGVLEIGEEVQNLGLDGEVEAGKGFVEDEGRGLEREGAGDGEALALTAAELAGEDGRPVGREPALRHQFEGAAVAFGAGTPRMASGSATISAARMRGLRVPAASWKTKLDRAGGRDNFAGVGLFEARQAARERGFAGAGLTYQRGRCCRARQRDRRHRGRCTAP